MRRRCDLIDVQFGLWVEEMLSKQASERRWDAAEGLAAPTTSPAMEARDCESKGLQQ